MLKAQLIAFYFVFKIATCSCSADQEKGLQNIRKQTDIHKTGQLDKAINESSGLTKAQDGGFWTHNDSGGKPIIYRIHENGNLIDSLEIRNAKNVDWEDITTDPNGSIYIGDFGNNGNARKDLKVYKITRGKTEVIHFNYADQDGFPPENRNFDCEAFFWFQGNLHLFSKSRVKGNLICKHYLLPDQAGEYSLRPDDEITLNQQVTAADVSPDGTKFALQTYGKTLLFNILDNKINFNQPAACIKTKRKQTEAIAFKNDSTLLFTNEQGGIYSIDFRAN